jgi:hypothetical protein
MFSSAKTLAKSVLPAEIMHDYLGLYWDGVEKAVDEFFVDKPEKVVPIPDKSGTVVIRRLCNV